MGDANITVVNGVGGYWGGRLAARLLKEPGVRLIGLDGKVPAPEIPGLDFIQADSRSPLLAELLRSENVGALCHLDFLELPEKSENAFQRNVLGAMNVLGACAEAGVDRIVLRSSTAVYGAQPDNSAFLTEESPLRGSRRYGYTRDLLEIESFCNGYRGQWPEITLTILRFANIIGPTADSPMTRFLNLQAPPILLGFDPLLQLIHEEDVLDALVHALLNDRPGAYNVAAEDVMPLSRILRLVHRISVPIFHPLAYGGLSLLQSTALQPLHYVPIEWDYLRYSWVADLARMHDELGFVPLYSAAEGLREYAGMKQREEGGDRETTPADEEQRLRDIIERRRRMRTRQANS